VSLSQNILSQSNVVLDEITNLENLSQLNVIYIRNQFKPF